MDVTTETHFPSDQPADLVLTTDTKYFLHTAARWANFIAIIGFIGAGFIVLLALLLLVSGTAAMSQMSQVGGPAAILGAMGAGGIAILYLFVAVFYFFFAYYLFRFAASAKKAVLFNNSIEISKSMESLKSFFKLWGIVTIIAIAFCIIAVIGGMILAATVASSMR